MNHTMTDSTTYLKECSTSYNHLSPNQSHTATPGPGATSYDAMRVVLTYLPPFPQAIHDYVGNDARRAVSDQMPSWQR